MIIEKKINFYRKLNNDQKKRINIDHKASVKLNLDGELEYLTEKIITPKGLSKENKRIFVIPEKEEKIVSLNEAKHLFHELSTMNLILTNACNLSCTYCYEQHNKDFGRFTEESLLQAYNFLLNYSDANYKTFQFFGGEPLIHKDLILSFLQKNKDYLLKNSMGDTKQHVSMITNGLLLTPDFIEKYFDYEFTWAMISLDTLKSEKDHRELTQQQIYDILEKISLIPKKSKQRVLIRCTISQETSDDIVNFCEEIYNRGVKSIIIHPLILDSTNGFIKWSEEKWNNLHKDLLYIIGKYQDLKISFSEGVGKKGENNCMIGSDMVAIDGSGDFSGCYFFTNQKGNGTGKTILGNVFNNTIYIDRYKNFQNEFLKMLDSEEQCRTCDYKNACYQCPAGNLDTGSKMFRPDDMCQKVVKLYLDLQDDVLKKQFKTKLYELKESVIEQGENYVFSKSLMHLMYKMFTNKHASIEEKQETVEIDYEEILYCWKEMIEKKTNFDGSSFINFFNNLNFNCSNKINIRDFYYFLLDRAQIPKFNNNSELNENIKIGYLTLLHIMILNNENKTFNEISLTEKIMKL